MFYFNKEPITLETNKGDGLSHDKESTISQPPQSEMVTSNKEQRISQTEA